MQSAILRVKLAHLNAHNAARQALAAHYDTHLQGVSVPAVCGPVEHVYHLYVIRHPQRDNLIEALAQRGVGTLIHYPIAVHQQEAYRDLGCRAGSLPVTEHIVEEIVSLPLHPALSIEQISYVTDEVNRYLEIIEHGL
jgi:dTDP-4-amino-4,6-dideoxygalactose transaminase